MTPLLEVAIGRISLVGLLMNSQIEEFCVQTHSRMSERKKYLQKGKRKRSRYVWFSRHVKTTDHSSAPLVQAPPFEHFTIAVFVSRWVANPYTGKDKSYKQGMHPRLLGKCEVLHGKSHIFRLAMLLEKP